MTLSDSERAQLILQHKQERDGWIRDRIKAVLLYDKGWSFRQIAEALLISDEAVRNHLQDYNASKKLSPKSGGSKEKLSRVQSEKLELHLQKHTYLYLKDIAAYVEAILGISYTVRGLQDWLKRHGFSYKKPAVVPGKANKEQQEKWLVEYNKLREELPANETICFIDCMHPTHNVQPAYGWIKKGGGGGKNSPLIQGALDAEERKRTTLKVLWLFVLSMMNFFGIDLFVFKFFHVIRMED